MQFDHINLTVNNVEKARTFLKKHFGYTDAFDDNNADMSVLASKSGTHISLMRGADPTYPKTFHIGFDLKTESAVNAFYERLKSDGLNINPPKHAWGSWTFYFKCPGGDFTIEVACASEKSDW